MNALEAETSNAERRTSNVELPAIDRIREVARAKGDDFDAMLQEYLREGIVVSNPQAFLMALPITISGDRPAWFVKAAAGDLRLIARMFPTFRPWVVFNRAKPHGKQCAPPKVYDSRKLFCRICGIFPTSRAL